MSFDEPCVDAALWYGVRLLNAAPWSHEDTDKASSAAFGEGVPPVQRHDGGSGRRPHRRLRAGARTPRAGHGRAAGRKRLCSASGRSARIWPRPKKWRDSPASVPRRLSSACRRVATRRFCARLTSSRRTTSVLRRRLQPRRPAPQADRRDRALRRHGPVREVEFECGWRRLKLKTSFTRRAEQGHFVETAGHERGRFRGELLVTRTTKGGHMFTYGGQGYIEPVRRSDAHTCPPRAAAPG